MYLKIIKPLGDFVVALTGLLVLSPVFIIVMLALYVANSGKAFFFQKRPGKNERIFSIVKFKTMNDKTDEHGRLLSDAERLTAVGRIVRKTSLDEIPQLINVLKGDMSLIGPRPLLPEYLPRYTAEQRKRHQVKPGITGLAQVKGRNQMMFSERLKNDVFYVENLTFSLDLKILILTIRSIFFRSSDVVHGQSVDEVDDLGLSHDLNPNFKSKKR